MLWSSSAILEGGPGLAFCRSRSPPWTPWTIFCRLDRRHSFYATCIRVDGAPLCDPPADSIGRIGRLTAVTLVTFVLSVTAKSVAVLVPWFEVQKGCGRLRRRTKIQQGWGTSAGQA
jgi:hypothetical protein